MQVDFEDITYLYMELRVEIFSGQYVTEAERATDNQDIAISAAGAEIIDALGPMRGQQSLLIPDNQVFQAVYAKNTAREGFCTNLWMGWSFLPVELSLRKSAILSYEKCSTTDWQQTIEDAASWSVTATALRRPIMYRMTTTEFIESTYPMNSDTL
jgi:hypothetical protein